MGVSQIGVSATTSTGFSSSQIITSSNPSWSVPSGIKVIRATIVGADGGSSYMQGWPPYFSVGVSGGSSSITAGANTYTAEGGAGAQWAGPGYNLSYTISSGPWIGRQLEIFINVESISSLSITIGSGGTGSSGGYVILSY